MTVFLKIFHWEEKRHKRSELKMLITGSVPKEARLMLAGRRRCSVGIWDQLHTLPWSRTVWNE